MRPLDKSPLLVLFGSALLVFSLLFAAGCHSAPKGPGPTLTAQQRRGQQIFQANCSVCHNAYKNEPLQGPSLAHLYKKDLPSSGSPPTDQRVRETILLGRNMMPPFNMALQERQIDDLIAYLHTL